MRIHPATIRLSTAHFFVDAYSSMFGAFLPFLHRELGLTLTEAGLLGGALIFTSSFLQPAYGYLSDRLQHRAVAAVGPALAGVFISGLGLSSDFSTLLALTLLGGLGIGLFHPQGTACVCGATPERAGYQLSVFFACGMIGYALGPLFITSVIEVLGLRLSYWAAVPGLALTVYLLAQGPAASTVPAAGGAAEIGRRIRLHWRPVSTLFGLVVLRSAVQLAFVAFLPLLMTLRGYGEWRASQVLTLFLLLGGIASFAGGAVMDRYGGKLVISLSTWLFVPLLFVFLVTRGPLSIVCCVLGGGALLLTLPVNVAMAQKLIPGGAGTVSALMMGFAWGVGGVSVPLVGWLSDAWGLEASLIGLMAAAAFSIPLAWSLPQPDRRTSAGLSPSPAATEWDSRHA